MTKDTFPLGYCTNVHAGVELEQAQANLQQYAVPIRDKVCPGKSLPVGLWLSENAVQTLKEPQKCEAFRRWMNQAGLGVYTFNGFPQGDFHQPVVKHEVYKPTWLEPARLEHTQRLADVMSNLLESDQTLGSISTLPLGWPHEPWGEIEFAACAANLKRLADHLAQIYEESGKEIVVAIEPEPGCVLNTAPEISEFFTKYLFDSDNAENAKKHLSVCHDICHSGVMFEPQATALGLYRSAGIRIGKVQVSSAVHVGWDECKSAPERQTATLGQLKTFNEPKYLHQTTTCNEQGELSEMCTDLPYALENWIEADAFPSVPWRIHFHVPIHISKFDFLGTTQRDIVDATDYLEKHSAEETDGNKWFTGHYEVETYAWPVLPPMLAESDLSSGIAKELQYFQAILQQSGPSTPI